MENNSNNKWLRILQPVGFILATILASMAIAVGGMKLASRFNLTTSREQAALSRLVLSGTEAVLPGRGTTTEGAGWVLRNTRGMYTLTLDGAEFEAQDGAAVEVDGDLTVELKRGSRNRIFQKEMGSGSIPGFSPFRGRGVWILRQRIPVSRALKKKRKRTAQTEHPQKLLSGSRGAM